MGNIEAELVERMGVLQARLEDIAAKRADLEEEQRGIEAKMQALRVTLDYERTLYPDAGKSAPVIKSRKPWLGMSVGDAVERLLEHHPDWGFLQIRDQLVGDDFDFKGKKPGNAINMVLIRRKRNGGGSQS